MAPSVDVFARCLRKKTKNAKLINKNFFTLGAYLTHSLPLVESSGNKNGVVNVSNELPIEHNRVVYMSIDLSVECVSTLCPTSNLLSKIE